MLSLSETKDYPHEIPMPALPAHFTLLNAQKTGAEFDSLSHERMRHDLGLVGFDVTPTNDNTSFMVSHGGREEDESSIERIAWHYGQTEVLHSDGTNHRMVFQEKSEPDWTGTDVVDGPFLDKAYTKLPSGHKFQLFVESPFNKSDDFDSIKEVLQAQTVAAGDPWHYGNIEGADLFHAMHPAHDALVGLHVYQVKAGQIQKLVLKTLKQEQPSLIIHGPVPSELRGRGPQGIFPHCYKWEDAVVVKADGGAAPNPDIYMGVSQHYGTLINDRKTNLQFYDGIQQLGLKDDSIDESDAYIEPWRILHEKAHDLTEKEVDELYGPGRRSGRLGIITPREAKRALHWEYLAAIKQREITKDLGFKIGDDDFNREVNTLMHESVHRVITGQMTEPSSEGFEPSPQPLDWAHTLSFIDKIARRLGLKHDEQTFDSAQALKDITEAVLTKSFLQNDGDTVTDPKGVASAITATSPSLMQWGIDRLIPLNKDDVAALELDGRTVKVRKLLADLYSGWIEENGQIRHTFERVTMPELLLQLQSKLELYGKDVNVAENKDAIAENEIPMEEAVSAQISDEKVGEASRISDKLKDLQSKVNEVAETIPGKDLVAGIENPEEECSACERPVLQCICYTGLPKPRILVTSKGVEIFFKHEWGEEDRINFLNDLKQRAGTLLQQKLIKKATDALTDIRRRIKDGDKT